MLKGIRYLVLFSFFVTPQAIAQKILNISPAEIAAMLERPATVRVVPGDVIVKYKQCKRGNTQMALPRYPEISGQPAI